MPELIYVSAPLDHKLVSGDFGVISGSFDPPTLAHLALAEALREEGCRQVLLLYSVRTLPKEESPLSPGGRAEPPLLDHEERARCLAELTRRRPWLFAAVCMESLIEEQALLIARRFPDAHPIFGVGSDKLIQIFDPSWYSDHLASFERLFDAASLAYAIRAGEESGVSQTLESNERFASKIRKLSLSPALAEVSSREVRRMLSEGTLPEEVPEEIGEIVLEAVRSKS
ncbi:MAG: hypothetical protein ACRD1T_15325 [Acidimicrobiia bacterium]